jgi:hypothetical protein
MTAQLAPGASIWLPGTAATPFVRGTLLSSAPGLVARLDDGSTVEPADEAQLSLANESTERDNTSLLNLSDATLLANTRERCAPSAPPSPHVRTAPRLTPHPTRAPRLPPQISRR